jgi:hypothetical protein
VGNREKPDYVLSGTGEGGGMGLTGGPWFIGPGKFGSKGGGIMWRSIRMGWVAVESIENPIAVPKARSPKAPRNRTTANAASFIQWSSCGGVFSLTHPRTLI